jgi:hypothetical protein
MGAQRVVLLAVLAMIWSLPAQAQPILPPVTPLTNDEINALESDNIPASQIEARIDRNVYDAEMLAEEVLKDFDKEVIVTGTGAGLGAAGKAVEVFKDFGEIGETGTHCYSGANAPSLLQKNDQIGIAHDNVIKLEQILQKKLIKQYGEKNGNKRYFRFVNSSPVKQFQGLNLKKTVKVKACNPPTQSTPPRQTNACYCPPPTRYPPTPEGGRESEAATNAYAECETQCHLRGGGCGVTVRC